MNLYDGQLKWHRRVTKMGELGGETEKQKDRNRHTESWDLEKKKEKKEGPTMEKEVSSSKHPRGWMWKPEHPRKIRIVRHRENSIDINLHEGSTATKAHGNKNERARERERETNVLERAGLADTSFLVCIKNKSLIRGFSKLGILHLLLVTTKRVTHFIPKAQRNCLGHHTQRGLKVERGLEEKKCAGH